MGEYMGINISNSSTSSHPSNQQPSTYPLIETSYKQNVYSISPTDSHNRSCHDRLHDPQERRHSIIWQGPRLRRREMPGLRRQPAMHQALPSASQHATTLSGALRAPSATPLLRSRMLQVERWFTIVIPTGIGLPRRASWSTSTSSQRSGRLATIPSSTRSLPASKVQNNRQNGLGKGNGKRG